MGVLMAACPYFASRLLINSVTLSISMPARRFAHFRIARSLSERIGSLRIPIPRAIPIVFLFLLAYAKGPIGSDSVFSFFKNPKSILIFFTRKVLKYPKGMLTITWVQRTASFQGISSKP